jgi:hypothetical protein
MTTDRMKMGISAPRVGYWWLLVISSDCLADAPLAASDCPYGVIIEIGNAACQGPFYATSPR